MQKILLTISIIGFTVFHYNYILPRLSKDSLNWFQPPGWNIGVPSSIQAFHTNSSWNGIPNNASYTIFNLSDPEIELKIKYSPGNAETLEQWIEEASDEIIMICNAAYFDMTSNLSISLVIINNTVLAPNVMNVENYYPTRAAFGIYSNHSAVTTWVYSINNNVSDVYSYPAPSPNCFGCEAQPVPNATFPAGGSRWNPPNAIGSGPVLLKQGNLDITWEPEMDSPEISEQRDPRTAICITKDGRFIVIVVDGRNSEAYGLYLGELAMIMQTLNCSDAMNLDGGGSTSMIFNGYLVNRPSDSTGLRPVPSVLMVVRTNSKKQYPSKSSIII